MAIGFGATAVTPCLLRVEQPRRTVIEAIVALSVWANTAGLAPPAWHDRLCVDQTREAVAGATRPRARSWSGRRPRYAPLPALRDRSVRRDRVPQDLLARPGPQLRVEHLDLDRASVARVARPRSGTGRSPRSRCRAARARAARPAGSGRTQSASWNARDPVAGGRDQRKHPLVPPHVVRVERDRPPPRAGTARHEVQRPGQRRDHAAVRGEHRVHRLDREPHPDVQRVRRQRLDARRDPRRASSSGRPVSPPQTSTSTGRPSVGRLVDRPPVVVAPVVGAEEPAAAQRASRQAGVAHQRRRPGQARTRPPAHATARARHAAATQPRPRRAAASTWRWPG